MIRLVWIAVCVLLAFVAPQSLPWMIALALGVLLLAGVLTGIVRYLAPR